MEKHQVPPIPSETPTACELCFVNVILANLIEDELALPGPIITEVEAGADLVISEDITTIEDLCVFLENERLSTFIFQLFLDDILEGEDVSEGSIEVLIDCLLRAEVIVEATV